MNKKMIKGAALTGLGVALLLGGGGTLARWNAADEAGAGTIVAGDLNVEAQTGEWTSELSGEIVDITNYRVIPGETLVYSQELDVTLVGDELEATLKVTGTSENQGFTEGNVSVEPVVITTADGEILSGDVLTPADVTGTITALPAFEFHDSTSGREDVNQKYDFSDIGYELTQHVDGVGDQD